MASITDQKVHSGSTIYLMIGQDIIGRAQSMTVTQNYGTENNYGIGSIQPQESVYQRAEYTVELEKTLLKKEPLTTKYAKYGDQILSCGVVDILVVNQLDSSVIMAVRGCSQVSAELSITANQFTSHRSTWTGLLTSDTTGK